MSTQNIIFVHGWGENPRIWDALAKHFPGYTHHFIDLGFIGEENDSSTQPVIPKVENAILITHSLGTLWVLNHIPLEKITALAAINGFGRFTDFAEDKTLKIMAKSLQRNMFLQMQIFWKNCNLPENMQQIYEPVLKRRELSQGLTWLSSWDEYNKLQELKTRAIPVLALGGDQDLILPRETMRKHWGGLEINLVMNRQAGHALPLTHPKWCAEQIKKGVCHELETKRSN